MWSVLKNIYNCKRSVTMDVLGRTCADRKNAGAAQRSSHQEELGEKYARLSIRSTALNLEEQEGFLPDWNKNFDLIVGIIKR